MGGPDEVEDSPRDQDRVFGLAEQLLVEVEKLSQEAKRKAEAEADALIAAAREQAEQIHKSARQVADKIVKDADGRARTHIRQTIDDAVNRLKGLVPELDPPMGASNGLVVPAPPLDSAEHVQPAQDRRAVPRQQQDSSGPQYDVSGPAKGRSP